MRIGWLVLAIVVVVVVGLGGCGGGDCPADQLSCGGSCFDPLSSNAHCGTCDNACGDGFVCGNGACSDHCPLGQAVCDGTCLDVDTDPANCGGCGEVCGAGDECTDGVCHQPCDSTMLLTASIADPWGVTWDGLERSPAPLDVATTTCAAFGATLPTATELYRVSAPQSGAVGQSFQTNYLWSRAPNDRVSQVTVRLSDGGASSGGALSALPYRCVCPAVKQRYFTGNHCNGPPGAACFVHNRYNFDVADRPALRKSAALWECVNERAHMADLPVLAAAIRAGLPGSGAFVSTADAYAQNATTTVRWSGPAWELAGNLSSTLLTMPAPFRCAAPAFASSFNTTPVTGEYLPKLSTYKAESADIAAASWTAAHDYCWLRGGHLPRATDLAELIGQGLPAGTGADLWTADQVGLVSTQFYAAVLRWTGLDQRYPYENTGGADSSASWDSKAASHPFRCIYYPLDPAFTPPTTCNGGCNVRSAGSPAVTISFDLRDRPAATVAAAVADCASTGGHLASERDYMEAIRDGLENGSAAFLLTWDVGQGNQTMVRWTGVDRAFSDLYPTYMDASSPATPLPYRCMWTNEVR